MKKIALFVLVYWLLTGISFASENSINVSIVPYPKDSCVKDCEEVIFQGIVLERLPSPGIWCGIQATYQGVRFKVVKVIKGSILEKEAVVFYPLVSGSSLCESTPILSQSIFKVGEKLRIKTGKSSSGEYISTEESQNVTQLE